MSKSPVEMFIESRHKMFIDSITSYIDSSYLTIMLKQRYYNEYRGGPVEETEGHISEAVDTNGHVIAELMSVLPDEAKKLANITQAIETIKSTGSGTDSHGFGGWRDSVGSSYHQTYGTLGTFHFHYFYRDWDEFGTPEQDYEIDVSIPNVVYVNHNYYCVTRELVKWLSVEGKAKRQTYLKQIMYA
jgi:hypothetical protein